MRIVFLLTILLCGACSKKMPQGKPTHTTPHNPKKSFIDNSINEAVTMRDFFTKALDLDIFPYGKKYEPNYFQELQKRKKSIIAWAKDAQLEVIFIGQRHEDISGASSKDSLAFTDRVQRWVHDRIKEYDKTVQLITIEQEGTDERLTPEMMIRITIENLHELKPLLPNMPPSIEQDIPTMVAQDTSAIIRAIRDPTSPPIYCGEEWPNQLQATLVLRNRTLNTTQRPVAKKFHEVFSQLRSEIILIRTLELLRTHHGTRAIIIQGSLHAQNIAALGPIYHTHTKSLLWPKDL